MTFFKKIEKETNRIYDKIDEYTNIDIQPKDNISCPKFWKKIGLR